MTNDSPTSHIKLYCCKYFIRFYEYVDSWFLIKRFQSNRLISSTELFGTDPLVHLEELIQTKP